MYVYRLGGGGYWGGGEQDRRSTWRSPESGSIFTNSALVDCEVCVGDGKGNGGEKEKEKGKGNDDDDAMDSTYDIVAFIGEAF